MGSSSSASRSSNSSVSSKSSNSSNLQSIAHSNLQMNIDDLSKEGEKTNIIPIYLINDNEMSAFPRLLFLEENINFGQLKKKVYYLARNCFKEPIKGNNEVDEECYYLTSRINKILNNDLIFPKLDFDEFEVFIALYKKLIEINETKIIINKILEEMNEKTKKDFKNILIVQKIIIKTKKNDDDTLGNEKTEENIVKIIHRPVKPKNNLKLS